MMNIIRHGLSIGIDINRPKSFRTVSPSPEGEGWDEGINRMQELMERLIE